MRYEYTLQKWSKTAKYVQYEVIENAVQHDLEELKMMILRELPGTVNEANGVTVDVKFLFTRVNHKSLRSKIALTIVKEGLLKLMYNAARKFVVDNRPFNEFALFDEMFHNELPRSCFVNLYPIVSRSMLHLCLIFLASLFLSLSSCFCFSLRGDPSF